MNGFSLQSGMVRNAVAAASGIKSGLVEWWENADLDGKHATTSSSLAGTPDVIAGPNCDAWKGLDYNPFVFCEYPVSIPAAGGFTILLIAKAYNGSARTLRETGDVGLEGYGFFSDFTVLGVASSGFELVNTWALMVIRGDSSGAALRVNKLEMATIGSLTGTISVLRGASEFAAVQTLVVWSRQITDDEEDQIYNAGAFKLYSAL